MKLLILTLGLETRSRYRILQFLPELARCGLHYRVLTFAGDMQNELLLAAWLRRILACWDGRRFDLAWIEGQWLPGCLPSLERMLAIILPTKRVYDLLCGEIREQHHTWITSPDPKRIGESKCLFLPWVIDNTASQERQSCQGDRVGWLAPSSRAALLWPDLRGVLRAVSDMHALQVTLVGAHFKDRRLAISYHDFVIHKIDVLIAQWDLAVFALETECLDPAMELNLLRCMAMGVPVVTMGSLDAAALVEGCCAGYGASDCEEMATLVLRVLVKPELGLALGEKGRQWVRQNRTVALAAQSLFSFLKRCHQG